MNQKVVQITHPAILQQRLLDLEKQVADLQVDLANEKLDHEKAKFERDCYRTRIEGFERMTHSLAIHVDKICRDFDRVTGGALRLVKNEE